MKSPSHARPRRRVGMFAAVLIFTAIGFLLAANTVIDPSTAADSQGATPTMVGARATDAPRATPDRPSATSAPLTTPDATATPAPTATPDVSEAPEESEVPEATAEAVPTPVTTPPPTPSPEPAPVLDPPPAAGPFAIDLYSEGDFISEYTPIWCVPAAMQTMINIMEDGRPDHSRATQRRLYELARAHSTEKLDDEGAEPEGWAEVLGLLGYGSYRVHVEDTRTGAIQVAARALRLTGRPVGLLTWRGAHSWVMSGFKATADPAYTDRSTVTHVYIEDVWYPRISSIWGASRPPDALVPVESLPEDYLPWDRPKVRQKDKDGRFVVVLPVVAEDTAPG